MLNKYIVGIDYEEPLGVYYAEDEKAAISECKQDHLFQYGKRLTHKLCRVVGKVRLRRCSIIPHTSPHAENYEYAPLHHRRNTGGILN